MLMGEMIFDTHAHYDDEAFDGDRENILENLTENGIEAIVNISSDLKSIEDTLALTRRYPQVYGAAGIHPCSTDELDEESFKAVLRAALEPAMAAIGEIGLDYYWDEPGRGIQKKWFERQLELAREIGGVIHCFSYGTDMAREYLNMGFYLGIGGVLTFQNAKKLKEVAAYAPLDRLVLETDCPYLAPVPHRGKRNCSLYLKYVVKALADIKGLTEQEIIRATNRNAKELYRLDRREVTERNPL